MTNRVVEFLAPRSHLDFEEVGVLVLQIRDAVGGVSDSESVLEPSAVDGDDAVTLGCIVVRHLNGGDCKSVVFVDTVNRKLKRDGTTYKRDREK